MQKIKELLGLCNHEFGIIRQAKIWRTDGYGCTEYDGVCTEFHVVCKKCGKHNIHKSNTTFFGQDFYQVSFPTVDCEKEKEYACNLAIKLQELKHKYKINQE